MWTYLLIVIVIIVVIVALFEQNFILVKLFPSKKKAVAWCPNCGAYYHENGFRLTGLVPPDHDCKGFYGWSFFFPPPHRWSKWVEVQGGQRRELADGERCCYGDVMVLMSGQEVEVTGSTGDTVGQVKKVYGIIGRNILGIYRLEKTV